MPSDLINYIYEPLEYAFMTRAIAAVVIAGIVCGVVGTFVVLRGMAFLGDALSHAILPGVAMGYLVGGGGTGNLFWWGLFTAMATALGIGAVSRGSRLKEDTTIGIFFAGMFALGIGMISTVRNYAVDLTHILFGNVLSVSPEQLTLMSIFSGLILLAIFGLYKELLIVSFDHVLAVTLRLPVRFLHYLLLVMLAVTIVVALQAVGVALMLALLVTPAATAMLVTRRVPGMMALAAVIGAGSGIAGLYLSYYADIAAGPAIVMVCSLIFVLVSIPLRLKKNHTRGTG
jgi:ABC-type Mn2+/Zn2+ transport system permease subunit